MPFTIRQSTSGADLFAASGEHPFLRYEISPGDSQEWIASDTTESAVLFVRHNPKRGAIYSILGAPSAALSLLDDEDTRQRLFTRPVASLSVPIELADAVKERFRARTRSEWKWMWTTAQPPVQPAEPGLIELGSDAKDELERFLAEHNPRTDGAPFARPDQRWIGAREDGRLVACGCAEPNTRGIPGLSGITVAPDRQGRGYGAAVTAALTRTAVQDAGACTLGMYSDNERARELYHRLGYTTGVAWASYLLTRR